MKGINNKSISFFHLLTLTMISATLFSRCGGSTNEKLKIRSEYLERHAYRQHQLDKIKLDIRQINDQLDVVMSDSSAQLSGDSAKSLLRQSFRVLRRCERLMYEMEEFDKEDSLMFEMYGR